MNKTTVAPQTKTASFLPPPQGLLQRKCACGNHTVAGGECAECAKKKRGLQRKLSIGASNDPLELEADRVADRVMAAPANSAVSSAPLRIQRYSGQASEGVGIAPANVDRVLASSGRPFEPALRQDMEQRFGHDFSQVRVHTGGAAEQSARDVSANAYTVGHNIVFGANQFAPGSQEGKRLIAHELTHVVQQSSSPKMLQRAENDTVPGCAALTDTQADLDTKVNASLIAARAKAGTPPSGIAVAKGILDDLGSNVQVGRSAIEVWASTLPPTKASLPPQSATKYAGVNYGLWAQTSFPILNPTMKISDICVGSDKLGHFFQQGATYLETKASKGEAAAEEESERTEGGGFGLETTGVFSNADQEANRQGGKFYNELITSPKMSFAISRYISSKWSEVDNPNFYENNVGHQVWANTLTGYWTGQAKETGATWSEIWMGELKATPDGKFTGRFSVGGRTLGSISNGVITYSTKTVKGESIIGKKTSPSPITGIRINFDWTLESVSGKGFLNSTGEQHLNGSWGRGISDIDRGTWDIKHT